MYTLGIAHDLFISSAALVRDGEIVAAIAEERLIRQKQYKGFPKAAVTKCLEIGGIVVQDLSAIALGWNPVQHLEFPNQRQSNNARWRPEYLYAVPNMLIQIGGLQAGDWIMQNLDGVNPSIYFYDHQLAHAANAYYLSGYERAAVFTADGTGERATTYLGYADRDGFHKLTEIHYPHSLGLLYGAITQYLGFKPDSDEWKVMALASFGKAENVYLDLMRALVTVDPETGHFHIDQRYFSYATPESYGGRFYTPDFVECFGPPHNPNDREYDARHYDIAYSLQQVFEETVTTILHTLHRKTGENKLVAAGGSMLNSVYNGKITAVTPFEEVFISSCPDDSGISVGAALLAYHQLAEDPKFVSHPHNYWGPSYDEEILDTLSKFKLKFETLDNPSRVAAQLLVEGKILGWYQGRMEFGQRALGNRSILIDPRRHDGKDLVNAAVKYRESFRPFAPAILAERVAEYFYPDSSGKAPFMERVFMFREEVRDQVPAVVHVDGTGRLQTVERRHNPTFYDLIKHFEDLTGVPIVLNTSFNLNGEAIVCTPADAVRTFYTCGLDVLIMGNYLLRK